MGFSFCSFVHCRDLVRMTICWKASGAVWWNCSLGKFLEFSICSLRSRLRAPLRIFLRQTLCRIFGQTLGQKPSGPAAPRVFGRGSGLRCGFGFAFGKSFGVPSIYSLGNRLRTLGTSLGNSFTTLHPRLFNRLYQSDKKINAYSSLWSGLPARSVLPTIALKSSRVLLTVELLEFRYLTIFLKFFDMYDNRDL